jgi:chorismate-pyruvate lyase
MNTAIHAHNLELPASKLDGLTRPLDYFYARAGLALPEFRVVGGGDVPEPFHRLLVHVHDMTPTLEEFYGDEIELRVLGRRRRGQEYWREVVLLLRGSGRPVEFGANRVLLDRFPSAARQAILDECAPLGRIMRDHQVTHTCQPNAFLEMQADALMGSTLQLRGRPKVFGRHNRLYGMDGLLLSEVVEILRPPPGND